MPSLNAEAEGELATDLSAAQALCALYPEDAPHPLDVHDRLREVQLGYKRATDRERAFLEGYYEITKTALDARRAQEARERAAEREGNEGGERAGEAREDGAA